jgi:dipeptidyl aminopeptidase/acylaminoacyl peptidase
LNLTTGERTLIRQNTENVAGWMTDLNGNLRLGIRQTNDGGTEILNIVGDSLVPIYSVNAEESVDPLRFTPDGNSFYLMTSKGNTVDKIQLELYNLKTGKTKFIEKDPENQVDLSGVLFSDVTNEMLATWYIGDQQRIYPKQKEFEKDFEYLKKVLPKGHFNLVSNTYDEQFWLVSVSRDVDPASVYTFDRKTKKTELLYRSRPNLPSENLCPMKPVRYKARDGMSIPGFLTLPKGVPPKNLPAVLYIHGGPWARDMWGYNGIAQFLANRGYAVFQINFRGSTGYGKKFLNAGNKQWGTGSMQHDISDGVKYLVSQEIADRKRIAISGGSYGGYATLAGLAFTPDLYAAGFDIVGPSNIITLLNSIPPYWAPMQKTFAVRVGDKDDPKDRKMLEEQSPLFSAKNIQAPLFVVQGANDPRVKKAEADQIVVALRDLGRQVEYMVAPDEGHGFAGQENRLAMFTAMEKFIGKHLNGRVQQDVRDAIQKKLDAITVDVNTVTMPKQTEAGSNVLVMPQFDGTKLQAGTLKYSLTVEARGKKIPMNLTRDIVKVTLGGREIWRIVDKTTGMMASSDTLDVDAKTLLPIRRMVSQAGGTVNLTFTNNAVDGMIIMGPQEMPVKSRLPSPAITDGVGTELPVSVLPLADGYKTSLSTFDIMSAKVKILLLEVKSSEKITAASATSDTWKIEMKPQEDDGSLTTMWIAKDTRTVVKTESKLPAAMGGSTVTMELTQ